MYVLFNSKERTAPHGDGSSSFVIYLLVSFMNTESILAVSSRVAAS